MQTNLSDKRRSQIDWTGNIESISLLLLLLVAMPMKYVWGDPTLVRWVGMAHGVLFIAFVAVLLRAHLETRWPMRYTLLGVLSSFVPFGPKLMMKRLLDR